jgi:ribonuclease BN (tRNA processing enzyme)
MVTVRFIGTGDAFGSGGRYQACILVDWAGYRLLLDCGASSLIALRRAGIDPHTIDAILVSHLHGDHFGGIPFVILDAQFRRRGRPLLIAGPSGIEERLHQAMEVLLPGSSQTRQAFSIELRQLPVRQIVEIGAVRVTAVPVDHTPGANAVALRLAGGGSTIGYSGDTAWTDALLEVADRADLFICEAYGFERAIPYHLDYRRRTAERPRLTCRRVILTHLGEAALRHLDEFEIEAATDGLTTDL